MIEEYNQFTQTEDSQIEPRDYKKEYEELGGYM